MLVMLAKGASIISIIGSSFLQSDAFQSMAKPRPGPAAVQ